LVAGRERIAGRLAALADGSRVEIGEGRRRLVIPADVDDLARLCEAEPHATIVAGSTDVGLRVTKAMKDIAPVIFIGGLGGLRALREHEREITIGAGVTYSEAFGLLAARIPALGRLCARSVGAPVRDIATR